MCLGLLCPSFAGSVSTSAKREPQCAHTLHGGNAWYLASAALSKLVLRLGGFSAPFVFETWLSAALEVEVSPVLPVLFSVGFLQWSYSFGMLARSSAQPFSLGGRKDVRATAMINAKKNTLEIGFISCEGNTKSTVTNKLTGSPMAALLDRSPSICSQPGSGWATLRDVLLSLTSSLCSPAHPPPRCPSLYALNSAVWCKDSRMSHRALSWREQRPADPSGGAHCFSSPPPQSQTRK